MAVPHITRSMMKEHGVPLVDSSHGLDLFCTRRSSNVESHRYRGIVVPEYDERAVVQAFPYCQEIVHDPLEENAVDRLSRSLQDLAGDLKDYTVLPSYEGTVIRVFCYQDKWFTSTHRKLNAFESFWADRSTSFGSAFARIWLKFFPPSLPLREQLDKSYTRVLDPSRVYMFLLRPSPRERVVCEIEPDASQRLIWVGSFDQKTPEKFDLAKDDDGSLLSRLPRIRTLVVENVADLSSVFLAEVDPDVTQGLLLMSPGKHVKILHSAYATMRNWRGETPSIPDRFIELLLDPTVTQKNITTFHHTFREHRLNELHRQFYLLTLHIYQLYLDRYVFELNVHCPKVFHFLMVRAHAFASSGPGHRLEKEELWRGVTVPTVWRALDVFSYNTSRRKRFARAVSTPPPPPIR